MESPHGAAVWKHSLSLDDREEQITLHLKDENVPMLECATLRGQIHGLRRKLIYGLEIPDYKLTELRKFLQENGY